MWGKQKTERLECDFVVVGSGAGGATAAYVLSKAGFHVIVLEEGPRLKSHERPRALLENMRQSMRDAGMQTTTRAHPITVLQGRLVGGSTAINSGIIWRTPDDVREHWRRERGLEPLAGPALDTAFDQVDRELEVTQTQDHILGGNSSRMREAAEQLGLPGKAMHRNAASCQGSAQCLQGCPNRARMSMDVSLIPRSEALGARVLSEHRVTWIQIERGRATGVEGFAEHAPYRSFHVRARRAVILAAGAVHSPALLLRRGFRGAVGHGFQSHPGSAMIGHFERPIGMSFGATQGYEVPMRKRGYKLESLSLPPELLAARIAGAGKAWKERITALDHYAQWVVQVRMEARGRVRLGFGSRPQITYQPTQNDLLKMREALCLLATMMLRTGATEVHPGIATAPATLRKESEVDTLAQHPIKGTDLHLLASHLFGTCAAGSDPRNSVVDPNLQHHECEGLYVMDGSALPTNLGVNPQHTIMALCWVAAERLANSHLAVAA